MTLDDDDDDDDTIPLGDALAIMVLRPPKRNPAFEKLYEKSMVNQMETTRQTQLSRTLDTLHRIDRKLTLSLEMCDGRIAMLKELDGDLDIELEIRADLVKEIELNKQIIIETELLR